MGRLVYVREVRLLRGRKILDIVLRNGNRTGRRNHGSSDRLEVAEASAVVTTVVAAAAAVVCKVAMEAAAAAAAAATVVAWEAAWVVATASFTSPTFVFALSFVGSGFGSAPVLTAFTASIHCGLARFEGLVPPSRCAI
jgi:hypothetical protein